MTTRGPRILLLLLALLSLSPFSGSDFGARKLACLPDAAFDPQPIDWNSFPLQQGIVQQALDEETKRNAQFYYQWLTSLAQDSLASLNAARGLYSAPRIQPFSMNSAASLSYGQFNSWSSLMTNPALSRFNRFPVAGVMAAGAGTPTAPRMNAPLISLPMDPRPAGSATVSLK